MEGLVRGAGAHITNGRWNLRVDHPLGNRLLGQVYSVLGKLHFEE